VLSRPQTNKTFGSNDYDPPPGYGSVPQAQFSPPPSSTFQPPNLVIGRQSLENQQQEHITGGNNQAYGQTSRAPEVQPQYRAYNIDTPPASSAYQTYISNGPNVERAYHPYNSDGQQDYAYNRDTVGYTNVGGANQARSPNPQYGGYVASEHRQGDRSIHDNAGYDQHAYEARSDETTATINSPDATASSRHNSYQETSRNTSSIYNNNYAQQSQIHQPSASDSGNVTPRYDAQPRGSYDSRNPANYNTHTPSSCAAPQDSYAGYQYSLPSEQQSRGSELQSQPSGSFDSQPQQPRGSELQPKRHGGLSRKPVPTQSRTPSSSSGAIEDEKSHDNGGLDRYSRYSSGYDVSQYRNY
jgi:hypothetical protein